MPGEALDEHGPDDDISKGKELKPVNQEAEKRGKTSEAAGASSLMATDLSNAGQVPACPGCLSASSGAGLPSLRVRFPGRAARGTLFAVLLMMLTLTSAGAQGSSPDTSPGTLISAKEIKVVPLEQAEKLFDALAIPIGFKPKALAEARRKLGPPRFAVRLIQIVYYSRDFHGKPARASGLVMEAQTGRANPVISYQHGTIMQSRQAPSFFKESLEAHLLLRLGATRGYSVIMPDYVGKGIAASTAEPFMVPRCEGGAAADLMTAYEKYIGHPIPQLFLAGYSQGGHATAATHITLEKEGKRSIAASALMSGPYDLTREFEFLLFHAPEYGVPIAAQMVAYWSRLYFPTVPRSAIYKSPFDRRIALYDQLNPSEALMLRYFRGTVSDLLKPEFIHQFLGSAGRYHRALAENNVLFVPRCPTRIYQSANDTLVSPAIAEEMYYCMKAGGARDVKLIMLPTAPDHHDATLTECVMAVLWFDTLVKK